MARANRHYLPKHVWHITHRCHKKEFLLKFSKDRQNWLRWLFEAKKRYGFCVLNYIVTSNHIHLLVQDTNENVIPQSMQLIAGRSAQDYNQRKKRKGAYWEDRYNATAIESDNHLFECMTYIDLNMIRAGVVKHPIDWKHSGYYEIQNPPKRYSIIDLSALLTLTGFASLDALQQTQREWIDSKLENNILQRQSYWTDSVAVGSQNYIETLQARLGVRTNGRQCVVEGEHYVLKEPEVSYNAFFTSENVGLSE